MKNTLKVEEFGLLILFSYLYFQFYNGDWGLYLKLFFVPDVAFIFFLITKKAGAIAYNIFHHKGLIALLILTGFMLKNELFGQVGLIFMAHSCFDRMVGYGLKYLDDFDHTHLGWIGKSKHKNQLEN
jgi:hypothetical protein